MVAFLAMRTLVALTPVLFARTRHVVLLPASLDSSVQPGGTASQRTGWRAVLKPDTGGIARQHRSAAPHRASRSEARWPPHKSTTVDGRTDRRPSPVGRPLPVLPRTDGADESLPLDAIKNIVETRIDGILAEPDEDPPRAFAHVRDEPAAIGRSWGTPTYRAADKVEP